MSQKSQSRLGYQEKTCPKNGTAGRSLGPASAARDVACGQVLEGALPLPLRDGGGRLEGRPHAHCALRLAVREVPCQVALDGAVDLEPRKGHEKHVAHGALVRLAQPRLPCEGQTACGHG